MVHLTMRRHCNWPTDHAVDLSSTGLNSLTIQLVFNEVSLFTFSKGTHGFYVTVPKNYLKSPTYISLLFILQHTTYIRPPSLMLFSVHPGFPVSLHQPEMI